MAETEPKVKSLYKAIKMLDYFDTRHQERGISELAQLSGMLKSTVYNIMSTYEMCGFVVKNPENNRYRLGFKILELGNVVGQDDLFREVIRPFMNEIAEKTGEVTYLATPYGTQVIYREAAFPPQSLSIRPIRGVVAPMYCTAIGKSILAYQKEEVVERVIEEGLEPFTPNTIVDPSAFKEELLKVKEQGYALDNMEHEYGVKCVGVPIWNRNGQVAAAISVSGPSLRFNDQKNYEYHLLLKEVAKKVQDRI